MYLYHGSKNSGIKVLEPRKSTHGNYVYATPFKELTVIFSGLAGDDLTQSIYRMNKDEPWNLVERIPGGFDLEYSGSASIYTLSDETFKDINTGFAEVVSEESVPVLNEEQIVNVYDALVELHDQNRINIYRYPNRPAEIPSDDQDLIDLTIKASKRYQEKLDKKVFSRLVFLHPHLLDRVNEYLKENGISDLLTKEDLVEIFKVFVGRQMDKPDKIYYVDIAYQRIGELYPELLPILDEEMEKLHNKGVKM